MRNNTKLCNKRNSLKVKLLNGKTVRLDHCMKEEILKLNKIGWKTVACCCGHGVYPKTILAKIVYNEKGDSVIAEITKWKMLYFSPRKKFYKKDLDGYYFIPLHSLQVFIPQNQA